MSAFLTPGAIPFWRLAIPSLITLGNAACGFTALYWMTTAGTVGQVAALTVSAWAIQSGWIFDMVDGMVARALKANSPFGAQLDSLCDAITFGVAPALLVATSAGGSALGWMAGLIYLWAAIVRLARFTVECGNDDEGHLYFSGLPSPAAAALVAGLYMAHARLLDTPISVAGLAEGPAKAIAAALVSVLPWVAVAAAVLMVSRVRFPDMPKHYLKGIKPRWHLVGLGLVAGWLSPAVALALYFSVYTIVGVLGGALRLASPPQPRG
jgi:CDP-diacylglycerol--serine O-phosphatidyltransferase